MAGKINVSLFSRPPELKGAEGADVLQRLRQRDMICFQPHPLSES